MAACRFVAFADGPAGYIYEFDGTGITHVECRVFGWNTFADFNPSGAAQTIRYYIDPVDETGALVAVDADTDWEVEMHRGNGFINLGLFNLYDPPQGTGDLPAGTFGALLYGDEYYSAAVVESSSAAISATSLLAAAGRRIRRGLGVAISATSSIVATLAHRFRQAASATILAVGLITGGRGRKLWENETDPTTDWSEPDPASDLWMKRDAGADPWSEPATSSTTWTKRNSGADPWS
jgi:hypothetical protein